MPTEKNRHAKHTSKKPMGAYQKAHLRLIWHVSDCCTVHLTRAWKYDTISSECFTICGALWNDDDSPRVCSMKCPQRIFHRKQCRFKRKHSA